jgi:uncharacterized protein (DUF885 family)
MHNCALVLASLLTSGALAAPAPSLADRRKQLSALLAEQWEYNLRTNPEFASQLGDKRYNDQLTDFSEKAVYADLEQSRQVLARFKAIDTAGFPEQESLNKALMVRKLALDLEGAKFKDWEMPVSQFGGIHINAPQLVSVLPFDTVKDYDDYIARLKALPLAFAQTTDLMRKGMADKLTPPKILLEQVARQASGIAATKPEESPFLVEPAKKMPKTFPPAERDRLNAAMLAAIRDGVQPAYVKFAKFVADEYAPAGRKDPGLWSLPDGQARYAFAVKTTTTTELTPDQIHQIGLDEVARDRAAMLQIAKKLGAPDLKSFDAAIKLNPKLHPKSRKEMLDLYRKYTDEMWSKLPRLFGRLPKAKVEIMSVEAYREKEASGAQYEEGTPDGKRPGHIKVNTGDFEHRTTLDIETTTYHEGVPGHHLQISIAQELPTLVPFRQHGFYIAFVEGWALYAERLGEEVGAYQDPYSYYGHLQDDLLRAIRLVVDTGFHAKHWTRQQVVDYFHDNSGIDEVNVQSETDRYMAWPAQALGYKIGQLKFLQLRERAKQELGDRFDVRRFHDEVLSGGAMPLDVLETRVAAWTAAQRAPATH